jgi:hypothetical protein
MSASHENTILTSQSQFIDLKDPASQKKIQKGDRITICNIKSGAFLTDSLSASENRCPFCQEVLSNEKIPHSSNPSPQPKKPVAKKDPAPKYEDTRRSFWGGLAALSGGGIILLAILCVVGALIISVFNSGSPTSNNPPISYATQVPQPIATRVQSFTPTPRPVQSSSNNNSSSGQQQSKKYAEISCAEIFVVNLRRTPGFSGKDNSTDSLYEVPCGEIVELLGSTQKADGLTWWKVSWSGYTGWIADHTSSGKIILDFNP